ncbi:MAG: C40 family peptidase [Caulobacteraceae bacterium]
MNLDPRVTLARADLAVGALQGIVRAKAFRDPAPMQVISPTAWLRGAADPGAEQTDQLLFGEVFDVLETGGEVAWGQARRDGYVGFVDGKALSADVRPPTHWVACRSTWAFAEPSVRAAPFGPIGMNALVSVEETRGRFARAAGAGWIAEGHLRPLGSFMTDPAQAAEPFLAAPYLWGGRDASGLDCSGLVQQALSACGLAAPRDTDQQAALGHPIDRGELHRGDLVVWRGHIGIMLGPVRLLHANAHHMAVAAEPLDAAISRIAADIGAPVGYRRVGFS